MRVLLLAAALLGALCLAACGKKGPPSPPGPADQVIYPRNYPVAPKGPPAAVSPQAQWPFGIGAPPAQQPQP